jgi:hypothetical protein
MKVTKRLLLFFIFYEISMLILAYGVLLGTSLVQLIESSLISLTPLYF